MTKETSLYFGNAWNMHDTDLWEVREQTQRKSRKDNYIAKREKRKKGKTRKSKRRERCTNLMRQQTFCLDGVDIPFFLRPRMPYIKVCLPCFSHHLLCFYFLFLCIYKYIFYLILFNRFVQRVMQDKGAAPHLRMACVWTLMTAVTQYYLNISFIFLFLFCFFLYCFICL